MNRRQFLRGVSVITLAAALPVVAINAMKNTEITWWLVQSGTSAKLVMGEDGWYRFVYLAHRISNEELINMTK